ncbi:MAG: queuosine precursor transporter [Verrucomicrobiota bacterium]|nr:queuosine precursor transporter [Verrucomicrobiota bacterium]
MNELLFFGHILLVVAFSLGALRLGSQGLTTLVALQAVLANLFVVKQMTLFGLNVTCSDVFAIGSLLALNLLQEFFGREAAEAAIKVSFLSMVFFALMSQVHLAYIPSGADGTHDAFLRIFSSTPRIVLASMAVYYVVQQIDVRLFGFLREQWVGVPLSLRVGFTLLFSQTLDTVLFSFFGLGGIVTSLFDIILMSLVVKWIAIGCSAPFTAFAKKIARTA